MSKRRPTSEIVFWLLICSAGLGLCGVSSGCAWTRMGARDSLATEAPSPLHHASKAELVAHLNRNIEKTPRWRCTDAELTARGNVMMRIRLDAMLAVEEPRNFRLVAQTAQGATEVDLGSNEERFWFYVRQAPEPGIYTCKHEQMQQALKYLPFPIQPDWFAEVLGVIPFHEDQVELTEHGKNPQWVFLTRKVQSEGFEGMKVVTVVDKQHGLIQEQRLISPQNQVLATARMLSYRRHPETGAMIPYRVDFEWPREKLGLSLVMKRIDVESTTPFPSQTFDMPELKNAPIHDLGRAPVQKVRHNRKRDAEEETWDGT